MFKRRLFFFHDITIILISNSVSIEILCCVDGEAKHPICVINSKSIG